jgi:hypothetical protein
MLNLTSGDKDKDAISSIQDPAAAAELNLMNSAPEAIEDVTLSEIAVDHAQVLQTWTTATSSLLVAAITVKSLLILAMLNLAMLKYSEEMLEVDASLVP